MRYSKKDVQKETSRDAKQFMYGYTECINDLLEYLTSGKDGLPEHELLADEPAGERCVDCPANQFYLANTEKIMDEQDKEHIEDYLVFDKDHSEMIRKELDRVNEGKYEISPLGAGEILSDRDIAIEIIARFLLNPHPNQRKNYDREKKAFAKGAQWVRDEKMQKYADIKLQEYINNEKNTRRIKK